MVTLTLKNIPDELHARLKESALRNRRSLNSEILVRLECAFAVPAVDVQEPVDHSLIDRFKRYGRT